MKEQGKFFSWQHLRLLNIATLAKNIAWVVLVVFIFSGGVQIVQLAQAPSDLAAKVIVGTNVAVTLLTGVVYYLLLKGVSLGLNMIVETDVNYRDGKREESAR
jgi:hypothetical protein